MPLTAELYAVTPEQATATGRVRQWIRGNWLMPDPLTMGDPQARAANLATFRRQQPDEEWTPPDEPTPEEAEQRRHERLRELVAKVETGRVKAEQLPGGAWTTPVIEESDDGER